MKLYLTLLFLSLAFSTQSQELCHYRSRTVQLPPITQVWSVNNNIMFENSGKIYIGEFPQWREYSFKNSHEKILHLYYHSPLAKTLIFTRTNEGFSLYSYDSGGLTYILSKTLNYKSYNIETLSPAVAINVKDNDVYILGNFRGYIYQLDNLLAQNNIFRVHAFSSPLKTNPIRSLGLVPLKSTMTIMASKLSSRSYSHIGFSNSTALSLPKPLRNNYFRIFKTRNDRQFNSFGSFTYSYAESDVFYSYIIGQDENDLISFDNLFITQASFFSYPITSDQYGVVTINENNTVHLKNGKIICTLSKKPTKQILTYYKKGKRQVSLLYFDNTHQIISLEESIQESAKI